MRTHQTGAISGPGVIAKILHNHLAGDPKMAMIFGQPPRLYDYPPEDPVYPYLSYGTVRSEDRGGDETELIAHSVTLHVWSRYSGRAEILELLRQLSDSLDGIDESQDTHRIVILNTIYTDVFRARDNRTQHGLIRLSITTETLPPEHLSEEIAP